MFRYCIAILVLFVFTTSSFEGEAQIEFPKNIVLVVVDGLGYGHLTAAAMEKGGELNLFKMKYTGSVLQPENKTAEANIRANYIATGKKASQHGVGVDEHNQRSTSILEIAKDYKKSISIISTASVVYPSVAAFYAHQDNSAKDEDITAELFKLLPDMVAAGGMKYFGRRKDDRDLLREFKQEGYRIWDQLKNIEKGATRKNISLIENDHLDKAGKRGAFLEAAWHKAFKLGVKSKDGYFVLIVHPHIDWAARNNDTRYAIDEVLELDELIGKILMYAGNDNESLVLVVSSGDSGAFSHTGGSVAGKRADSNWASKNPTPQMAPVFAQGIGAENFSGVYTLDQIFQKLKSLTF